MSMDLRRGDCLELMKAIPDASVDLVLADPPYNIGCTTSVNAKHVVNDWDKIDGYVDWCIQWLHECQRVLKPTGVLYLWHNDMRQIPRLLTAIEDKTRFVLRSFCIWDKGNAYRARTWQHRDPEGRTALRSWFNVCEYCMHFFKNPSESGKTGLKRVYSNPECFRSLKDWYASEKQRLGLSDKDIREYYTQQTGRKPHMFRHYFQDSQFEIPTQAVWEAVFEPLGFRYPTPQGTGGYDALREGHKALRDEYEGLRAVYEQMRNVHVCDDMHCNVWRVPPIKSQNRFHTCQKPVEILERLCRVSTRGPGAVVLDPFMGSGSTGIACLNTGREFIGIEKDSRYFEIAQKRLCEASGGLYERNEPETKG